MNITQTLYVTNRKDWRAWLKKHSKTKKEIWLVYYRQEANRPRIPYNAAVEEALCFGWIDSLVKKLDEKRFVQRFSPRNPKSRYSQTNQERLRKLIAQGKVSRATLATLADLTKDQFKIPADILRTLKANPAAWKNFKKYSKSYQRIRIAYIDGARKRPDEFKKRLKNFIKLTAQNKQFGFDIKKYY